MNPDLHAAGGAAAARTSTPASVFGLASVAAPTAAEASSLDRDAQARGGVPGRLLMENAGRSAALVLHRLFPAGRIVAAVGGGNNGGDAIVLLRSLRAWGRDVAWFAASDRLPDPLLLHGFEIPRMEGGPDTLFAGADLLVDGILGTGATGAPREPLASLIRAMNASGRPVLALDLPSGVDATTGGIAGESILANLTVTFGSPKLGLLLQPGRARCGRLIAVEIGFPPTAAPPACALITPAFAAARLPRRSPDAHKSTAGQILALAGRDGMAGAAAIAGRAALRAGAGYLRIASPQTNREILQVGVPDALFIDRDDPDALRAAAAAADALLLGPGIGTDAAAARCFDAVLQASPGTPALLDADALTLFAGRAEALRAIAAARPLVLTPHLGEMARLTGREIAVLRADPTGAARELADHVGCAVVLKGAPSVVASPGSPTLVNTVGSSDLAAAGMGDQLSGIIAALLAGGCDPRDAAAAGLFFAGRAADLAGRGRTLRPDDVSEALHLAFASPGTVSPPLDLPFVTFDQPPRW